MARVLIIEHDAAVRQLLDIQLRTLGHEPIIAEPGVSLETQCDAAVVEPATRMGSVLADALLRAQPSTPLIVISVRPPSPATAHLNAATHIVKPYKLEQLGNALEQALAQ